MENQLIRLRIFHNINRIKSVPCGGCEEQEAVGGDLLVSGGVQAPPDKLRSSYSV